MDSEIASLHEASLHILAETGVRFFHPKVLKILQTKGVKVTEQTAFFSPDQVMAWMKKAPAAFSVHARNSIYDVTIGGAKTEFAPGYGAPVIIDEKGNRRAALLNDYITFLKLVHQSSFFHINGGILVQPADLGTVHGFPIMLFATLIYSDKCLMAGAGGETETKMVFDMLDIVFGKESLIDTPRIMAILNSTSPLQYDKDTLDTLLLFAEQGQPVIITPAAMAGTTGPITLAGTIAMSHTEILAGIVLAQMIREGTPVVYGMQSTAADMKTGAIADGAPERALCVAYGARLAKACGLPCRGGGTENDAKSLSVQSGYESMMDMLVACQEKVNLIIHSAGTLDSHGAMSYEKFIVDLEILGMVRRLLRGIKTDKESLAVDIINSVQPGGEFLTHEHTMINCRKEPYLPFVSSRGPLAGGISSHQELLNNINKKKEEMLAKYAQPSLPRDTLMKLRGYLISQGFENINDML